MKTELTPIDSLIPDPANARIHNEKNLSAIKGSLARFGQQKPIVVSKDNVIRAGNGTWAAAKALGWTEIAIVRTDLTGSEATAFAITDNRTAILGDWDFESLAKLLGDLKKEDYDLEALGWEAHDLEPLLTADWSPPPISDSPIGGGEVKKEEGILSIEVTKEQKETFEKAKAAILEKEGQELSDGDVLEELAAAYLESPE